MVRLMVEILHYLKDPNCGNSGLFLTMGNAGFRSSTVVLGFMVWGLGFRGLGA